MLRHKIIAQHAPVYAGFLDSCSTFVGREESLPWGMHGSFAVLWSEARGEASLDIRAGLHGPEQAKALKTPGREGSAGAKPQQTATKY